jgi:predicted MFS family arabinose efflux permease
MKFAIPSGGAPSPWLVVGFGTLIVFTTLGMRHAFGFFLEPITTTLPGVNRDSFGLAVAIQNLVWGFSQPFAGMIADRYGTARVVFVGGVLYASGLLITAASVGPATLYLGFGVFVGLGLGCATFAVILGAVGRAIPPERRTSALGVASVGGAVGIFCSVPITIWLITQFGWQGALVGIAALAGTVCLAAPFLAGRGDRSGDHQSLGEALEQAMRHRGFLLLVLGFFVCGFQLAFFATHLPAFLLDQQMPLWVGGAALALIGLTNIIGTFSCGVLGDRISKTRLLAGLYTIRGLITLWFLLIPISPTSVMIFAAVMGLTWLGTVPLTSGAVAQIFGVRYLGTLVGIVFLMHQVGSFLGAWLGGVAYEANGSYDAVWWAVVALAFAAAVIHLAIDERPTGQKLKPRVAGENA